MLLLTEDDEDQDQTRLKMGSNLQPLIEADNFRRVFYF